MINAVQGGFVHKLRPEHSAHSPNPLASHRAEQTRQIAIAETRAREYDRYTRAIEAFRSLPVIPTEPQKTSTGAAHRAYADV
ncbi:MAG: hypothetical protein AB7O43_15590 [Hyphomicrobiaceae bacterium]